MPDSFRIPRDAITPRFDAEAHLRAAIRERNGTAAARLVQQWVHRRGLNDLERFQQELVRGEDPEAGLWLLRQWQDPCTAAETPEVHASTEPVPEAAGAPSPGSSPSPAVAEGKNQESDPQPSLTESFTEPLSEELRRLLATPLEDPFGEPAPRLTRAASPISADPLPASLRISGPPFPSDPGPLLEQAPQQDEKTSFRPTRRRTLSRITARMRGYLEDAMDALHRTPPPADPPAADVSEPPGRPEPSGVAAPSPTTLADLRAWLPDAADDVRRAS